MGSELSGFEQATCDVVREIPQRQRGASQMLETTVYRFSRPDACPGPVEVGEHISSSAFQGSPERGQLFHHCRHSRRETRDDGPYPRASTHSVGVAVGGHDALVNPPRHIDLSVLLDGEHCFESIGLIRGE